MNVCIFINGDPKNPRDVPSGTPFLRQLQWPVDARPIGSVVAFDKAVVGHVEIFGGWIACSTEPVAETVARLEAEVARLTEASEKPRRTVAATPDPMPSPKLWIHMTAMERYDTCVEELALTGRVLIAKWRRLAVGVPDAAPRLLKMAAAVEAAVSKPFSSGPAIHELREEAGLLNMHEMDVDADAFADALDDLMAAAIGVAVEVKSQPQVIAPLTAPDYVGTLYRVEPPAAGWPAGPVIFDLSRTPGSPPIEDTTGFAVANSRSLAERISELAEACCHRVSVWSIDSILKELSYGWSGEPVTRRAVEIAVATLMSAGRLRWASTKEAARQAEIDKIDNGVES